MWIEGLRAIKRPDWRRLQASDRAMREMDRDADRIKIRAAISVSISVAISGSDGLPARRTGGLAADGRSQGQKRETCGKIIFISRKKNG